MNSDYERARAYLSNSADAQGSGATEQELVELGSLWGPLPADFAAYLREFGWVTAGPHELFGLGKGAEWHQNLIERARELWRGVGNYKLPTDLLPFYDSGGGWFYCLSKRHPGHAVVCWAQEYEDLGEPQPYDVTYPSWSAWVLQHVAPLR
jgi:hypothetical protein